MVIIIHPQEFGKNKLYFANQSDFPVLAGHERDALRALVSVTAGRLSELRGVVKEHQQRWTSLTNVMPMSDLEAKRDQVEREIAAVAAEAEKLKQRRRGAGSTGAGPPSSSSRGGAGNEGKRMEQDFVTCMEHWRKTKRLFNNLWDQITENIETKPKKLRAEIGIETDEDVGGS